MRVASAVALLLALWAGGCASVSDPLAPVMVLPGKFDGLSCADLASRIAEANVRVKKFEDLTAKAEQEAGGAVVAAAVYGPDLTRARADRRYATDAARRNNCDEPKPGG